MQVVNQPAGDLYSETRFDFFFCAADFVWLAGLFRINWLAVYYLIGIQLAARMRQWDVLVGWHMDNYGWSLASHCCQYTKIIGIVETENREAPSESNMTRKAVFF